MKEGHYKLGANYLRLDSREKVPLVEILSAVGFVALFLFVFIVGCFVGGVM